MEDKSKNKVAFELPMVDSLKFFKDKQKSKNYSSMLDYGQYFGSKKSTQGQNDMIDTYISGLRTGESLVDSKFQSRTNSLLGPSYMNQKALFMHNNTSNESLSQM